MVSYEATRRKYRGKTAEGYEAKRRPQTRWALENQTVERFMDGMQNGTVLDIPVGTGRFLKLYATMKMRVVGVDVSDEMLKLCRKKAESRLPSVSLEVGDATALTQKDRSHDVAVCVRLLDLIPEDAMHAVLSEICRVARKRVILTIRVGRRYTPKVNTAVHDEAKFQAAVKRHGFAITEEQPIFKQGWRVMQLDRVTKRSKQ